jgi:hypothetical protein
MAANMTMTGTPKLADAHAPVRFTAIAGAAIAIGDLCYIDSGGLAQLAVSTQCTIANVTSYEGISLTVAAAGEAVTLFGIGSKIYLTATDQTIGTFWYVSATAGKLYDAKVATADTYYPVIKMITANVGEIVRSGM